MAIPVPLLFFVFLFEEAARLDARQYHGLIELHVEQGPARWKAGPRVAVVTAIIGRRGG